MPIESPSVEVVLSPPPVLALIGNLVAAVARSPALAGKPVQVRRVDPLPDGLAFSLEARGINFLVDGPYRLELAVLRTNRDSTLCDVRIAAGPGYPGKMVGTLFNWGLKLIPNALLNGLLRDKAGGAVHMEGDRIAVNHKALIAWLLKK
jgi:hypothetical protein